ncbi:MAG: SWIM zinc finger family protein [Nitrososphaerales archaeon]
MVNSSEIKRIYGEETYRSGKQYYDDGHVVTAVKLKDVVVGEILGISKYNTVVNLSRVHSTCSCPVGTNCKHGVALTLQYLSGEFIDGDEITQSLQRIDRSGILNVLEKLFKEDPSILLKIRGLVAPSEKRNGAPRQRMVISVEKQVRGMLKHLEREYGDKQFADTRYIY